MASSQVAALFEKKAGAHAKKSQAKSKVVTAPSLAVQAETIALWQHVELDPPGHAIAADFGFVPGATRAALEPASLKLEAKFAEKALGALGVAQTGKQFELTIPGGQRVRRLTLTGLKLGSTELKSEADLQAQGRRLVISVKNAGGDWQPLFSVPHVSADGMIPKSLAGASYQNKVLTLPDVAAPKFRVAVASGSTPDEFDPVDVALGSVTGVAAVPPKDLELVAPDGSVLWANPGEILPAAATTEIDLKHGVEQALNEAIRSGSAQNVVVRLRGAAPSQVRIQQDALRGKLVRTFPGVISTALAGEPVSLALPGPALGGELPGAAVADVRIRYAGIRLLPDLSADVPAAVTSGVVVGETPALYRFPPRAFDGRAIARIGIVGRAPVDCDVSVQLFEGQGNPRPLAGPASRNLARSTSVTVHWFEFRDARAASAPVHVSVRANHGRFFWVADPSPRVRVAIVDPDPRGDPIRIAGQRWVDLATPEFDVVAANLPNTAFGAPPSFESDLFVAIELADLTLSYAR